MTALAPLAVAIPLIVAALLAGAATLLPRTVAHWVSLAGAVACAGCCVALAVHTADGNLVEWFGGWTPRHGVAVGISFALDPIGAGMATLAALLSIAALVFSWPAIKGVGPLYGSLVLIFLAGMVGFSLTGDLFNLFVFFELMGVSAYALTGYKVEESPPLQGAINFAVVNTVAGYMLLLGIGLIYARTGALNMAQAGASLAGHASDGLIVVAFLLLTVGLLVKAAIVPFHFWLSDAHAVAPTPVCFLLSGVMVELGLYGVARVYWTTFSGPLGPHADAVRAVLLALGAVTAVAGAAMALAQLHIKRMLALTTISHAGLFLVGVGLLTPSGLGATAVGVVGHGFVKASLFAAAGILLQRFASVSEERLYALGRAIPWTGLLWLIGGLALAGMPPFGTFLGTALTQEAGAARGFHWITALSVVAALLTGGAVLRTGGRVFLGIGLRHPRESRADRSAEHEEREFSDRRDRTPRLMWIVAAVLLAAGLAAGLVPGFAHGADRAAAMLQARPAYAASVLDGRRQVLPAVTAPREPESAGVAWSIVIVIGAALVALIALFRDRIGAVYDPVRRVVGPPLVRMRRLQSGHVGDYVAWLAAGTAVVGAVLAFAIR